LLAGWTGFAAPNGSIRRSRDPGWIGSGHPFKNIRLEPANVFAAESLSFRKLPDGRQAAKHPGGPADQASDIMGSENLIPCWVGLIDPAGDRDALTYADGRLYAALNRISRHKRPFMWFRSFRVKLSRMAPSCALRQQNGVRVSLKIQRNSYHRLLTHQLGNNIAGVDLKRPA
jgi:hypothetical protein